MAPDVLGDALHAYFIGNTRDKLMLHTSYGDLEEMPIDVFFREPGDFPELEHIALALCDGRTLDVGAGAGSHALYLQERGFDVTALELSPGACSVMCQRGIRNVLQHDFFDYRGERYDTLLFLMNGVGLAGTVAGLSTLLQHCRALLRKGGQLLFDSSDINYLYADGSVERPHAYQGEIRYQYEYKGVTGEPFNWLFIDQEMLARIARTEGWVVQVVFEDENDQYLARMEPMGQ